MGLNLRFYLIGIHLFTLYAAIVFWPGLLFLVHIPIHSFELFLSLISWITASWFVERKIFGPVHLKSFSFNLIFCLLLFVGIMGFINQVYDTSYDGNWYHMDAVYNLARGWIPAYQTLSPEQTSYCDLNLNHFPKLSWIFGAQLYVSTGLVEAGKCGTLLLTISCLFVGQFAAGQIVKLSGWSQWAIGILLAINPIQLLSIFSFCNDGQLAALFSISLVLMLMFVKSENMVFLYLALLALALLANLKFTSAAYAGILTLSFFIYFAYQKILQAKRLMILFFLWGLVAFGILGFNPYVTNTLQKGNPLYPIFGTSEKLVDIKQVYPANFLNMNWFQKFYNGIFAKPTWNRYPDESHVKILFSHTKLNTYTGGIPDLAGFGPMIPEILVILIPVFLISCFFVSSRVLKFTLAVLILLGFSILINPEAWLLRYVPQFWLLILGMLCLVWTQPILKYVAWILALALLLNSYIMEREYVEANRQRTADLNTQFGLIKQQAGKYEIYHGWTHSFKNRLGANGIDTAKLVWISPQDSTAISFVGSLGASFRKSTTIKP